MSRPTWKSLNRDAGDAMVRMGRAVINPLVLGIALAITVFAGMTNYDSLTLRPVGTDDAFVVKSAAGVNKAVWDYTGALTHAGDATFSGTTSVSGAQTHTADVTLSGAGVDLLANAAAENEIGSDAAPFEKGWVQALDVEGPIALDGDLTIGTAGSDILVTDNTTDIGTEAASIKALYCKTLDADTSINTDGFLTVTGTGATTLGGTLAVTGASTLTGIVSAQNKVFIDSGGTGTEALIDASGPAGSSNSRIDMSSNGFTVKLAASPASGVSVNALAVTSAATTAIAQLGATTVLRLVQSAESIAAAATFAPSKSFVFVTGATAITSVTIAPYPAGSLLVLNNSAGGDGTGPVVTDGNNLKMAGNFTLGPDDTIAFISDGTNLYELFRSAN